VSYWDIFQSLLSQLAHEDDLLLARTQWLVVSQFLLLLVYVLVDKGKLPADQRLNHHRMISILGLVSTVFILGAILAAVKLFVELRTDMFKLMAEHPGLPMRKLGRTGIGAGLLCPILLSLSLVFTWSRLTFSNRRDAVLMTAAASLLSLFVIALAHEISPGVFRTMFLGSSFIAGIGFLIAAIWLGVRSLSNSPST
jgi:hypothetical protein